MCEIDPVSKRAIRIFRNEKYALPFPPEIVRELPKRDAVEDIRRQVFERCEGLCEKCGKILSWGSLHMHERQFKSKGGEVSVENGWGLCSRCHLDQEHGDRRPQWLTRS